MRWAHWKPGWACVLVCLLALTACSNDDDDDDGPGADDDDDAEDDDAADDDDDDDDADDDADDDDNDDNNDDSSPLPDGVYVAKGGADANPGTPDKPKLTIAAGLAAGLAKGLPVFVAEGTYHEAPIVRGELRGGYCAADWARDIAACPTIIAKDASPLLTLLAPEAAETLVEGFTVRSLASGDIEETTIVRIAGGPTRFAANAVGWQGSQLTAHDAYGVAVVGDEAVVIESCSITGPPARSGDSAAVAAGLAVLAAPTDGVVARNNAIAGGRAEASVEAISTGALVNHPGAAVYLARNVIVGGPAAAPGYASFSDGIELADGYLTAVNNDLAGGRALTSSASISAGIHANNHPPAPLLIGNTIRGGSAMVSTAVELASGAILINNILRVPDPALWRAALLIAAHPNGYRLHHNDLRCDHANCVLFGVNSAGHSRFYGSVAELNHCFWDACEAADGNLAVDPLFVSDDDIHLRSNSLCIDAGADPAAWAGGEDVALDIDGDSRPLGAGWDIGADEAQ